MRAANDIETIETTKKITTKTMTSETEPRDARGGDVDARRVAIGAGITSRATPERRSSFARSAACDARLIIQFSLTAQIFPLN